MMLAAVETVTKADPVWESRRHNSDVATRATARESVHAASPLNSSERNVYNEPRRASTNDASAFSAIGYSIEKVTFDWVCRIQTAYRAAAPTPRVFCFNLTYNCTIPISNPLILLVVEANRRLSLGSWQSQCGKANPLLGQHQAPTRIT
jgi:hypothetical protein